MAAIGCAAGPGMCHVEDLLSLCLPLDEPSLREAEDAASRFVTGPWSCGFQAQGGAFTLNGGASLVGGAGGPSLAGETTEVSEGVAIDATHPPPFVGIGAAGTGGGWSPVQVVPPKFGWTAIPAGTSGPAGSVGGLAPAVLPQPAPAFVAPTPPVAGVLPSGAHVNGAATTTVGTAMVLPPVPAPLASGAPLSPARELWSNMSEDAPEPLPQEPHERTTSPIAGHGEPDAAAAAGALRATTSGSAGVGVSASCVVAPGGVAGGGPRRVRRPQGEQDTAAASVATAVSATVATRPGDKVQVQPPQPAPLTEPTQSPQPAPRLATQLPAPATPPTGGGSGAASPEGDTSPPTVTPIATESPVAATPHGFASPVASPGGGPPSGSPAGRDFLQQRTWAHIVTKDLDATASANKNALSSLAASMPTSSGLRDDARSKKDTLIDYLLLLASYKAAAAEGKVNGHMLELPEELQKYQECIPSGCMNLAKAKYVRRGMKNDANNCYVNVVVQSLLSCSALMQLLSHCAGSGLDPDRAFYSGMVKLCKEFHRKKDAEPVNVLLLPEVKEIINTWQSIGAQQDAGEFLFYMLNGMHEECKWKVVPSEHAQSSSGTAEGNSNVASDCGGSGGGTGTAADCDDWAQMGGVNNQRRVEVRSAGVPEDSPIVRIFGGLIRSSVRSKSAKTDSVSLEPFNHLSLDISSDTVDSVWSAMDAYCGAEAVNEGRATKRLQFKMVPKVLILNLKRFSYNKDTECPQKIKKPVKFEEKLTFDSNWLVDDLEPQEYHLTAVINHHGESANGGHYNATVKYNTDWYMYDDAVVRHMELREVVNQQYTAYLLMYQCHAKVDIRA